LGVDRDPWVGRPLVTINDLGEGLVLVDLPELPTTRPHAVFVRHDTLDGHHFWIFIALGQSLDLGLRNLAGDLFRRSGETAKETYAFERKQREGVPNPNFARDIPH
jgi:hypothetical protein